MKKPEVLDLFCGVGGAGEGYERAGFKVTGVDKDEQPNNPHKFIKSDWYEYLINHFQNFDVIHASPPCQKYSISTKQFRNAGKEYPDLLPEVRKALIKTGKPFIIENVSGSPMPFFIQLNGVMFDLKVIRKRQFEFGNGLFILQPPKVEIKGSVKQGDYVSVYGKGSWLNSPGDKKPKFAKRTILETWKFAMNIPWAKTYRELAQAIPPNYTEYIGKQIINQLTI